MGQILRPESIGTITRVSNTSLTISPSFVNLGGRQYSTSTLGVSTSVSGAGGLDTGAIAANQFYYVYFIKNTSGVSGVLSLSGSAPTGFTNYKLVGQCTTDGSSNLVAADKTKTDDSPIGHIISAMLTESQFRAIHGSGWILADGRSVAGSKYNTITASATVPDLRGMVLRGKNNGRSDGSQDPSGERAIGNFQANAFGSHNHGGGSHSHTVNSHSHGGGVHGHTGLSTGGSPWANAFQTGGGLTANGLSTSPAASNRVPFTIDNSAAVIAAESPGTNDVATISSEGGNETRMNNIAVNHFIKIN
jgi:hypothetical protein